MGQGEGEELLGELIPHCKDLTTGSCYRSCCVFGNDVFTYSVV